jgi:two-component system, NarL family, nitrate/nitrite response regulator NarL
VTERIQVFVAEAHPRSLEAVEDAIAHRPDLELVGSTGGGRRALDEIRRLQPLVALLGMRMSGLDGSEVLTAIVRDQIPTRVLFLSTLTDSGLVYDMLARGAAGYIDKASSSQEICDAIAAVGRGEMVLSPAVEGGVLRQIGLRAAQSAITLSPREREVLRLAAEGHSASQIANRLVIEPSTVKSHLHNIYEKLGVSGRAAAVAEGMRRGLLD